MSSTNKRPKKSFAAVLGLLVTLPCLALFLVTGCKGSKGGDSNTIVIMSSLPRTGSAKGQTDTMVNGIKMALEEAGGKVGDFTIKFEDRDDAEASSGQWTAAAETANANEAVENKDVMVYIGPYNSGAAAVSMPILNNAGIVMISPAATATGLTKKNPDNKDEPGIYRPRGDKFKNFTRVVPTDDVQGPTAAKFIKEVLKKKRVYVLNDNERYGEGIAKEFEAAARDKFGLEVIANEKINVQQQEFGALMTKIKSSSPDVIYFGGTTQSKGGQIAKDMIQNIPGCVLIGPDGCYEQAFIDSAGNVPAGRIFVTFGGKDPSKLEGAGKTFVDNYRKKYNTEPEAYAVYGYEAAKVALAGIKTAGKKDRDAIREAILGIRNFKEGAIGEWSFNDDGDTTAQIFTISEVKGGKFHPHTEVNYAK